jgi:3-oxoacyl-[acyl-carrier-protein] synthase-3
MSKRAVIRSTGSYLPTKILSNADLAKMVDTSDEWIMQRSGIRQRHIAAENETTADLAAEAGKKALAASGLQPSDIDTVIIATTTPDRTFPAVATKVQADLGIPRGIAFDVQAVCTGFVYGLAVANSFILTGQSRRVLLIGAEKMSSLLNWADRTTCVLFGDGAGAIIIEADETGQGTLQDRGVFSTHLYAQGSQRDLLYVDGGVSSTQTSGHIIMQGRDVFKHAVQYMADAVNDALRANNIEAADIDWLVPHQANIRILEATAQKLGVSMDKVVVTVETHGNTSAASIPLALDQAVRDGRIKPGHLMLLEAMGGGLTWGSALVRF